MPEVIQTDAYSRWFARLRDRQAKLRINDRIRRLLLGNPGDVGPVGEGVSELRIDYGPGYRVYYLHRGDTLIVLLAGGDKDSQSRDIQRAIELARDYRS
ncbi:MAG: type II toxin-antitoxin system RelE/ParE family toxin [Chloroflexi bacterium]|nr:type II toxin-antitoxin system RelE/ParE family toxin [Chloroflexota bacterium]MYE40892.1 type II toxin-antitoxin system RelE/ParE family toxin [Chloroflexota bacterium]